MALCEPASVPDGQSDRTTYRTLENIFPSSAAGSGAKDGFQPAFDPAHRTQIIDPALDRKICLALKRRARQIARRAFARYLLLQLDYFLLQGRCTALRILCSVRRNASKLIFG
jgi:hypothetical protein